MTPLHTPQQFRRDPSKTQTAVRCAVIVAIVAACAAAVMNAGPGNGVQPRPDATVLKLPTIVVVGRRASEPSDAASNAAPTVATIPASVKVD